MHENNSSVCCRNSALSSTWSSSCARYPTSVLEGRCRAIRHLQLTQRLPKATKAILILRTYALWNRSKIVLAIILTAFFVSPITRRTPGPSYG
ncbi:hypothetical protein M405DRAFT_155173 [Rhizopogon salebrosus TDB-379]|nr:hypothetical protein M405DRAFT_155173 [Rhizopogon salebrosus TDB-379]